MNRPSFFMILFCSGMLLVSCQEREEGDILSQNNTKNKILPLGASRVEGNRPDYESYRYDLWKLLISDQAEFDFVGTKFDAGNYPAFQGLEFDRDHEGHGGWNSEQILNELPDYLEETGPPDIVLWSAPGGNDALEFLPFEEVRARLYDIIRVLQAENPDVTILIEQMAPAKSEIMTPELESYFANLQSLVQDIAQTESTARSHIVPVNMFDGFTDALLADDVHYNAEGAAFVASRYYAELIKVLDE